MLCLGFAVMLRNTLEMRPYGKSPYQCVYFMWEKGVGKTTLAASKWARHIMLNCSDSRHELTTTWLLENALTETFEERYRALMK
jgi:uncharacterized protein YeaO (DUF488 family)